MANIPKIVNSNKNKTKFVLGARGDNSIATLKNLNDTIDATNTAIADIPSGPGYLVYAGIISQFGGDQPEVIILENTLGVITWTSSGEGNILGTIPNNAFTLNKTIGFISARGYFGDDVVTIDTKSYTNAVEIRTKNTAGTLISNRGSGFEIRVYP